MRRDRAGVLFDVDGTLIDSAYLHTVCWAEALRQAGHEATMRRVGLAVGMGSDMLLAEVLGEAPDDAEQIAAAHDTLYKQHWGRLEPLPGARELLARCHEAGLTVVLATSASEEELAALRGALDAEKYIAAATSSADAARAKPSPDIVGSALSAGSITAEDAMFVGDSVWDVQAAAKAGVACIGVATGVAGEHDLSVAGAVATYSGVAALLDAFDRSPLAGLVDDDR